MNRIVGVLLLLSLLTFPAALVVGFSYAGTAHPIEKSVIKHDGFLKKSTNDAEILFFGFAGCATVCPTSLDKVASVLESDALNRGKLNVGGLFIEVKSTSESTLKSTYADQYSRAFSTRIRGYTPSIETYQLLAGEFILRLYESRGDGGQISHTDHFYILVRDKNKWMIDRVLSNQIDELQMIEIVAQSLQKNISK